MGSVLSFSFSVFGINHDACVWGFPAKSPCGASPVAMYIKTNKFCLFSNSPKWAKWTLAIARNIENTHPCLRANRTNLLCVCVTKNGPYACGNFTSFQKPQQLGRARTAYSSIVTSRAQRAGPNLSGQRCCKLRLKLLAKIERRLESWTSSSSPRLQRSWSARMATRWSSPRPACSIR